MARRARRRPIRTYGDHPLDSTCPLCDNPLGGGNQHNNPLVKWRRSWAHRACVLRERGE